MKRYLLFNSNCEMCSRIAAELDKELGGWLEIKSLNDSSVRDYLNSNHPNWSWEPMILLQGNEEKRKLLTGFSMKLFLTRRLGVYKAIKIARLIDQFETASPPSFHINRHRRAFLQASIPGLFGAIVALKVPQFPQQNQAVDILQTKSAQSENDVGELYHGFVLLPDIDSPAPSFVNQPQAYTRTVISYANEEALRQAVPFALYRVSSRFNRLPFLNAQRSTVEENGATTGATINYGELAYYSEELEADRGISLIVHNSTCYPSPYPIRPVHELNRGADAMKLVAPEKIRVGNAFGVLLPSSNGYVAHWIDQDVLYTLAVEDATDRETMLQIVSELSEI